MPEGGDPHAAQEASRSGQRPAAAPLTAIHVEANIPLARVHEAADVFLRGLCALGDGRTYPQMGHTVMPGEPAVVSALPGARSCPVACSAYTR
jgi:hypothetical protein